MSAHTAVRTCIGCRRRADQDKLVRLALEGAAGSRSVVVDRRRRRPGRGAWLHPSPECLQSALKRRAFQRAFRGPVESSALHGLFQDYGPIAAQSAAAPGGLDAPAVKTENESGSEI